MTVTTNPIFETIQNDLDTHDVVLYMKGTKQAPMCGFSSVVVRALTLLDVDIYDVNVLEDQDIRQGIKEFADWPTIPQLYIKGEFIGGADIVKEMYESGDLKKLLEDKGVL